MLNNFDKYKISYNLKNNYILGGASGTTCEEEISTNDGCGDTKKTLYKEDGSVCCIELTEYCCPM